MIARGKMMASAPVMNASTHSAAAHPTSVKTIWDEMKDAGKRASLHGQKAKLGADISLINNKISATKKQFGVDLYDFLAQLVEKEPAALIESTAMENIQGLFVTVYKNNKSLEQKRLQCQEELCELEKKRAAVNSRHGNTLSFEVPADSIGERIMNFPKNMSITGAETKIKTDMACIDRTILEAKHQFGKDTYAHLLELEKCDQWVPLDRDVRFHYDHARRDIAQLELIKGEKNEDRDLLTEELEQVK